MYSFIGTVVSVFRFGGRAGIALLWMGMMAMVSGGAQPVNAARQSFASQTVSVLTVPAGATISLGSDSLTVTGSLVIGAGATLTSDAGGQLYFQGDSVTNDGVLAVQSVYLYQPNRPLYVSGAGRWSGALMEVWNSTDVTLQSSMTWAYPFITLNGNDAHISLGDNTLRFDAVNLTVYGAASSVRASGGQLALTGRSSLEAIEGSLISAPVGVVSGISDLSVMDASTFADVTVASGAQMLILPGTFLTMTGNLQMDGSLTGSGPFYFKGSQWAGAGQSNVGQLTMDAPAALTGAGGLTVSNGLTLNANLAVTDGARLTFNPAAAITGAGEVVGAVTRMGPFALNTPYALNSPAMQVIFTGGTLPSELHASLQRTLPQGIDTAAALPRTMQISAVGGTDALARLQLPYQKSELGAINENLLTAAQLDPMTAKWTIYPAQVNAASSWVQVDAGAHWAGAWGLATGWYAAQPPRFFAFLPQVRR